MKRQDSKLLVAGVLIGAMGALALKKIVDKSGITEKVVKKIDKIRLSEEDFNYIYDEDDELLYDESDELNYEEKEEQNSDDEVNHEEKKEEDTSNVKKVVPIHEHEYKLEPLEENKENQQEHEEISNLPKFLKDKKDK